MGRSTAKALKELGHSAVIAEHPALKSLAMATYLRVLPVAPA
jgi:uroporphyrinogen-III synthase